MVTCPSSAATVEAGNARGAFTTDLRDSIVTCITRGVKGQCFMPLYRVSDRRAAWSLFWTVPDRRARTNGCTGEGCDGEQMSVRSGWMVCITSTHATSPYQNLVTDQVKTFRCCFHTHLMYEFFSNQP